MSPRSLSPATKPTVRFDLSAAEQGELSSSPIPPRGAQVAYPTLARSDPSAAARSPRTPHRLLLPLHFIPTGQLLLSWGCACGLQLSVNSALFARFLWKLSLKKELF